jgi:hypothetical protein
MAGSSQMITLRNRYAEYAIGDDGTNISFVDVSSGVNHCVPGPFAMIRSKGREIPSTSANFESGGLSVAFGKGAASVELSVDAEEGYLVFKVTKADGESIDELTFPNLVLDLEGGADDPLACICLALNLQTNVEELPRPRGTLSATCHSDFGIIGAAAALIATPPEVLREAIKKVVADSPDLPRSPIGGAWAMDSPGNRGSYVFNFDGIAQDRVKEWIDLARALGIGQIDFHGGRSFRFGDCRPDPKVYPEGIRSMRAVNDRLHGAGILAGLHTYAFFIDKSCPWVTPIPDPRLATDAAFTLSRDIGPHEEEIEVVETTEAMSTTTGFFVRNSVTLRIEEELITYAGVSKDPPYSFTGCVRGACGTRKSPHGRGSRVHHLKECFDLFAPDPGSGLMAEVIDATARIFNEGGFDMIYLDALDGEDVLGGRGNAWHYGSKYVYELWKRLERPALMEMSTFHHHLWHVRSRMGAWDHPNRSYKRFIDIHCDANEDYRRMFLPTQLGWWAFKMWRGPEVERTFPDDIEYLCCKAIGTDSGLSVMGVDPRTIRESPGLERLSRVMKTYEELREADRFPEAVRERMAVPGDEFHLSAGPEGGWELRPIVYRKHKVENGEDWSTAWTVENPFKPQPPGIRIEPLMTAGAYRGKGSRILWDFSGEFACHTASDDVTIELCPSDQVSPDGTGSFMLRASNLGGRARGAWARAERVFDPPIDLSPGPAMGLWVRGDGGGEIINLQLRSPTHIIHAMGEHYIPVDFEGWRYFELIEPEGERFNRYQWPYSGNYSIYRESVNYEAIQSLSIWYNDLPPGREVECHLTPVRALPLIGGRLTDPGLVVDGNQIAFPGEIEAGSYLESGPGGDCAIYGAQGELVRKPEPIGRTPLLSAGRNRIRFLCEDSQGPRPRANVTLYVQGDPIHRL